MPSYVADNNSQPSWHKASFCASNQCVEVAVRKGVLVVRDAEGPSGLMLSYTTEEWETFVGKIKAGRFDGIS